jgi:hypothetical protein
MPDESSADMATTYANAVALPAHHVTNINISATVAEITVTLGRLHSLVDPETNAIQPAVRTEWFQSLALNPIVAKQMYLGLGRALEFYETQFGKIPEDPGFRLASDADLFGRTVE